VVQERKPVPFWLQLVVAILSGFMLLYSSADSDSSKVKGRSNTRQPSASEQVILDNMAKGFEKELGRAFDKMEQDLDRDLDQRHE
jgi:hypothetical protein